MNHFAHPIDQRSGNRTGNQRRICLVSDTDKHEIRIEGLSLANCTLLTVPWYPNDPSQSVPPIGSEGTMTRSFNNNLIFCSFIFFSNGALNWGGLGTMGQGREEGSSWSHWCRLSRTHCKGTFLT